MEKSTILKNLDDLSKNPMFILSLTSKELFHSNFWAWILRQYPQVFTRAFYKDYDGKASVKIAREKDNIDLSLFIGDELVIIENKFKTMPDWEQLYKYWTKAKASKKKLVLISYFEPLFELEENWEYLSYGDLCERLQKCLNDAKPSSFNEDDAVLISSYIKFLELIAQLQENVKLKPNDKLNEFWEIVKDKEVQTKLSEINFEKTLQRAFITGLTVDVLKDFDQKGKLSILIDCGRDLKVYSDILIKFKGAWDKEEAMRQDLMFLGVSVWGKEYRYYAGLHKEQCGIYGRKDGRMDAKNKQEGYNFLSQEYGWFFDKKENNEGTWGGYSYDKEMYLYKKIDISQKTVEEIRQKIVRDLNEICEEIGGRALRE